MAGGGLLYPLGTEMVSMLPYVVMLSPILLSSLGRFDRNRFVYPLREMYRDSVSVQNSIEALGKIDELISFHEFGEAFDNSVLPRVVESERHHMTLKQARNPILGKSNPDYVPNDISLNSDRLTFITGPNSGGKTLFCKTVTQIQLLSQAGCYVPAEDGEVSIADRIFYQPPQFSGLESDEGRFGTEMKRTKEIFMKATPKSLVVLDELSEGTTYEERLKTSYDILDGFYRIGGNTILITHNHQLVEMFGDEGRGQKLQVGFNGEEPTYRLAEGVSKVSHADRVAKKIGFSKEDIDRSLLERGYITEEN